MEPRKQQFQVIDSTDIYRRNAEGTVKGHGALLASGGYMGIGTSFGILMLTALPFTTTIGAGIKTAIDVAERIPLPLESIDNTIQKLGKLNGEGVSQVISAIYKSPGSTNSCKDLNDQLKANDPSNNTYTDILNKAKNEKVNEIKRLAEKNGKEKLNSYMQNNDMTLFKVSSVNYQLSSDEKAIVKEFTNTKRSEIIEECRLKQIPLICDYLNAPHNAGKPLQHVIVNAVASIGKDFEIQQKSEFSAEQSALQAHDETPRVKF